MAHLRDDASSIPSLTLIVILFPFPFLLIHSFSAQSFQPITRPPSLPTSSRPSPPNAHTRRLFLRRSSRLLPFSVRPWYRYGDDCSEDVACESISPPEDTWPRWALGRWVFGLGGFWAWDSVSGRDRDIGMGRIEDTVLFDLIHLQYSTTF